MINLRDSYYNLYALDSNHIICSREAARDMAEILEWGSAARNPTVTNPEMVKTLFKRTLNRLVQQDLFGYTPLYSDARRYLIKKMCKQKLRNPKFPLDHVLNNSFYHFLRKLANGQFCSEKQKERREFLTSFALPTSSQSPTNPIVKSSSWSDEEEVAEKKDLVCRTEPVRRARKGVITPSVPVNSAVVQAAAVSTTDSQGGLLSAMMNCSII